MDLDVIRELPGLQQALLGALLADWLMLAIAWAVATALVYGALRLVRHYFVRLARRTANRIDDAVAEVLRKTRFYFVLALGLFLATLVVVMPEDVDLWVRRIAFVLFILQVARWGNSLITWWVTDYKTRMLEVDAGSVTTMQAVSFIVRLSLFTVLLLITLANFGVEITPLVASLGVGGIAVALAVQNILGDLFAALSIVLDKPFVVGDFLIVGDLPGTVEKVGLKTTRVRALSGEQLVFSNSDLLSSRIRNFKRMQERRIVFTIGVTYQTTYEQLQAIPGLIREIVEAQDKVRFDRAHFKSYGDFSLVFEVVYYVLAPEYNLYMDIQQAINLELFRRLEERGVEFAYPTQSLYVHRATPAAVPRPVANGGDGEGGRVGGGE